MPSPDQLAELQNPEILEAFLSDVKTSEIQSKLDALKLENPSLGKAQETSLHERLAAIAEIRKGATY